MRAKPRIWDRTHSHTAAPGTVIPNTYNEYMGCFILIYAFSQHVIDYWDTERQCNNNTNNIASEKSVIQIKSSRWMKEMPECVTVCRYTAGSSHPQAARRR